MTKKLQVSQTSEKDCMSFISYDSGMQDDTLSLLYDWNKDIHVKVETPSGLTVAKHFEELVLKGDT